MADEISAATRLLVTQRAGRRCEYCLLHADDSFTPHQIDHIVSRKHGGSSSHENLALACIRCNAWKGSDIAGFGFETDEVCRLYHPRQDRWLDHFRLEEGEIVPVTAVGAATVRLLRLNLSGRVAERRVLSRCGRYPSHPRTADG
ncbi:MAG: HNH endonuclease [Acidobacteria bacterium]|nr:HNH endonuclease [Acidobacteriota bacterium]